MLRTGKSPSLIGKSTISMCHFQKLCNKLPEGKWEIFPATFDDTRGGKSCWWSLLHCFWLVVWSLKHFLFFHSVGKNNPNWLIFFRGVETTNQVYNLGGCHWSMTRSITICGDPVHEAGWAMWAPQTLCLLLANPHEYYTLWIQVPS